MDIVPFVEATVHFYSYDRHMSAHEMKYNDLVATRS